MVFYVTLNNISVISWRSVLLVEETGVPVYYKSQQIVPRGRRGRDCEFETRYGEVYSIQHYVTKFVSDLR
jgi:hypothetical protein